MKKHLSCRACSDDHYAACHSSVSLASLQKDESVCKAYEYYECELNKCADYVVRNGHTAEKCRDDDGVKERQNEADGGNALMLVIQELLQFHTIMR